MGYYMQGGGDYYRRGSGGFWSSFAKGIAPALKFGGQLLTGNIPGALSTVVGHAETVFGHGSTHGAGASSAAAQLPAGAPGTEMQPSHAVPLPLTPGGRAALGAGMPAGGGPGAMTVGGKHFHVSKRTGQLVKGRRPRMNPLNVRALRRGLRRAHAFARIAKGVVTFARHGHQGVKFKGGKRRGTGGRFLAGGHS